MSSVKSEEELALREQVKHAQQKLGYLEQALHAADGELETLSVQQEQYQLLDQACVSLEKLDQHGVAHLFWGEQPEVGNTAEYLCKVRGRIESFNTQQAKVEDRRQSIISDIEDQYETIDFLDDDLLEVLEQEENRKAEWLIETEDRDVPYRAQVMPWARGGEEDQRFHKSLAISMLYAVLIALLLRLVDLPIPEFSELIEVPERVAQLIRQERELPPPQPSIEEQKPEEKQPEPDPEEPLLAEEQPPEVDPEPIDEPVPAEVQRQAAKQQVRTKGILAFRESFSSRAQSRPSAQLGSQARIGNAGEAAVGRPERSMVTTQGPGSSGGINLAALSRDFGGGDGQQIGGVQLTRVASSIGVDGGTDRPLSGGYAASRTDEEIQIVFDRYKSALYRLYNRELRKDPTLRGQLVLRLTIEPDGSVSLCQLQSSDMHAPDLAQQVVARVQNFDFGAKEDIVAMTIIYPIDFLPAA